MKRLDLFIGNIYFILSYLFFKIFCSSKISNNEANDCNSDGDYSIKMLNPKGRCGLSCYMCYIHFYPHNLVNTQCV